MARVILDTGVFFHPGAMRRAVAQDAAVVVPAIVFVERARQLRKRGRDVVEFAARLVESGIIVEPFRPQHGLRFAVDILNDRTWGRLFRDAMIAGHLEPGDVLWTTSRREFEAVGVPPDQIRDVP